MNSAFIACLDRNKIIFIEAEQNTFQAKKIETFVKQLGTVNTLAFEKDTPCHLLLAGNQEVKLLDIHSKSITRTRLFSELHKITDIKIDPFNKYFVS